jgi:prolycopene isomerase
LGGLSAGAILAKRGKKVLVLEKHYQIGGYATNFRRGDFEFDVALHQMGGVEKNSFQNILSSCGIDDQIEFLKHRYLYESIYDDFELRVKNGDIASLKKTLYDMFPKDKFGIWLWFVIMQKIGWEVDIWDRAVKNKWMMPPLLYFAPLIITILMFSHKLSVRRILNICTKDEKLQMILTQLGGYFGIDNNISMQVPFIAGYGYYFGGGYYIKGGSKSISNALQKTIEENGGVVMCNNEVQEVLFKDDKAVGVRAKKGEYYGAKVVSNASPFIVYEKLLSKWPKAKKALSSIEKQELSPSISQLYLGLDCSIEQLNPRFKDSYIVFLNTNTMKLSLTFHSNIDPSAVQTKGVIVCITYLDSMRRWELLTRMEYKEKKDQEVKKVVAMVESHLPNLQKHIKVAELGTPKTMERYTGNKDGAVYGFSQKISQAGFDRFSNKSPLKNLYFASAWTFPSGGFEGAVRSGYKIGSTL